MTASVEIPESMRCSVLRAAGELEVQERAVPRPGPREVLVRVASVGTCGSDVHYFTHGRIGGFVVREPLVLGHEPAGRIVAVGAGVDTGRIGQRVSVEPGVPCRRCRYCHTGAYNLCPDVVFFATPPVDGAFAEYVTIADDFAHPVPDHVSDDAAALLEPLSVALWAHHRAGTGVGARVLVAGAGPIGLLVAQVAAVQGAAEVLVSDPDPGRRAMASDFGATATFDPADGGSDGPADVDAFVDCSGAPRAVLAGLDAVRPGGNAVLVGMGADEMTLPVSVLQSREISLTGTFRYAGTWPTAVRLAASGAVDLDRLVTSHVDLDHVGDALAPDPSQVKVVVRP
ncbi:NAD(P)-dependent alcohol dehydrogenase [Pseudonocardia sp. HH130630-07]|uniref:NAD(P)-dependent alcohol dehydrogenase n=1 Tax=Pseudonocardia sp. HH130630-07 TaxID=1690815 RepID=UPI0008152EAC|nr:NAD(P)-dependent alcohol dehydrogenase [Pseudonocardia sp. HH130630-07]ANY09885.1 sorbitol dehydrogenase [Pseudonocardia sp. HH130630-07]